MDIGTNPGKYVSTSQAADENGRVYCLLGNRTRIGLTAISVRAIFIDDGGKNRQAYKNYSAILEGGKQDNIPLNWSTADQVNLDQRLKCEVQAARVAE